MGMTTPFRNLDELLARALTSSLLAGAEILAVYQSDFAVSLKPDRSPVTEADRRAHEIITRHLARAGLPVLSEEGRAIPYRERQGWDGFWLVDPLDGTREFVKRNGEFSVNIALIRAGAPLLGVVYIPVMHEVHFSVRGQGAFRLSGCDAGVMSNVLESEGAVSLLRRVQAGAVRLGTASADFGSAPVRVLRSLSRRSGEEERFVARLRECFPEVELAAAGSAAKFCILARGEADVYPRFGPTGEWDTAAGQCLLEEVGGAVLDVESRSPVRYNKPGLKNRSFIALGPRVRPGSARRSALLEALSLMNRA
jgi:3'(2'), 5'-bisphosphate nucleotidase